MPFEPDDFFVGMIAYFAVNDLRHHPRIRTTNPTCDDKPRPFVCYADDPAGEAYWVSLTGTPHPQRRTVSRRWLRCPKGSFFTAPGDLIISDGRSTFAGPVEAFAKCSKKHDTHRGMYRPVLLPPGVAEVQHIVHARGGLMPPVPAAEPRTAQAA